MTGLVAAIRRGGPAWQRALERDAERLGAKVADIR